LPLEFNTPSQFTTPYEGIRILRVPLGTLTFTSSFIKDALLEDARHVDLLPKMGDVQVAFGILTCYFVQHSSYFLQCTPPSSIFTESLISFDYSLLQVFGRLLGLGSFDSPKGLLVHKQTSLLITLNGVKFISTSTIALVAYLGSWVLVVLVITIRFMVDQHPFLLEALTWINNNTFPFQQHLKATCDVQPSPACACLPPFEQLIGQQMVQLQNSISKHLHHHTLSNMFCDGISEAHSHPI
jgi:hypothetical protein